VFRDPRTTPARVHVPMHVQILDNRGRAGAPWPGRQDWSFLLWRSCVAGDTPATPHDPAHPPSGVLRSDPMASTCASTGPDRTQCQPHEAPAVPPGTETAAHRHTRHTRITARYIAGMRQASPRRQVPGNRSPRHRRGRQPHGRRRLRRPEPPRRPARPSLDREHAALITAAAGARGRPRVRGQDIVHL
jgi:hypothetical protein